MIEQTTMTGPQYLRDVAMGLRRMGFPISAPSLEQLAAQWEADRDALERARALLVEQAEVITANVWHIPPEYSSRNAVLDAAVKMRDLAAALLSPAEGGAA